MNQAQKLYEQLGALQCALGWIPDKKKKSKAGKSGTQFKAARSYFSRYTHVLTDMVTAKNKMELINRRG